jgi:uncharacterized protein with PIN domain
VKILELGSKPIEKTYTVRCDQCKTKFEFAQHEATVNRDQRDGDYVSILCPVCGSLCAHSL